MEEIVDVGTFEPGDIHLPSIYVDRIVRGEEYKKAIEVTIISTPFPLILSELFLGIQNIAHKQELLASAGSVMREKIAKRAALEFKNGMYGML